MIDPLAIVLAAGKGTRMKTDLPKVAVELCGRPMIEYVLDCLEESGVRRIVVVVGYRADVIRELLSKRNGIEFVLQQKQLGTGHAVQVCHPQLSNFNGPVLIVTGDSPLIQTSSLKALFALYQSDRPSCIVGSAHKEDPAGLGRIVRDTGGVFTGIVEEKDATDRQRQITEVNMSTYVFESSALQFALQQISNENQQGEYYITDCPGILQQSGHDVRALDVLQPCEALSVNTVEQLVIVEEEIRKMR